MLYTDIPVLSRQEIETQLTSGSSSLIAIALISAALYQEDTAWVEQICLRYGNSEDFVARAAALQCFGHLARLHGRLNSLSSVEKCLAEAEKDTRLAGRASDVRGDLKMFLKKRI